MALFRKKAVMPTKEEALPGRRAREAMYLLDRPIWASLTTHHALLSEGNALARRFARDVNLFASTRDDASAAVAALALLVKPGESVFLLQVPQIVIPPGLVEVKAAKGVQMVATRSAIVATTHDIVMLEDEDAPEMLELATLTEPGPFLARTHTMGTFLGIRIGGRLVAMAGERMRFPGYTEVSGVCTHPEFRGRGFARRLSAAVVAGIEARGDQAFLHAWKTNHSAISLYEGLGFEVRTEVNASVLKRSGVAAQ
jgi:predicted GNAT family acetyltransferase